MKLFIKIHNWLVLRQWMWNKTSYRPTRDHACMYKWSHYFFDYTMYIGWIGEDDKFKELTKSFLK